MLAPVAGVRRVDRHGRAGRVGLEERVERWNEAVQTELIDHEGQPIGVHEGGVGHHLQVQMRSGRVPGVPEQAQHVTRTHALTRLDAGNASPVPWLRAVQRRLLQLGDLRASVDGGETPEAAMKRARVHFREEARTAQDLRRWTPKMIAAALDLARTAGKSADQYELQMLYGIRDEEQVRLVGEGQQLRVYVPFGDQWYGYFMRRLAERPANLVFFMRSLVTKN